MVSFLAKHKGTLLLFLTWFFVGRMSPIAFYVVCGASIILFWRKEMFLELFMGFLFVLILSDTINSSTDFAKVFKNFYILFLTAVVILERRQFPRLSKMYYYFLPFVMVGLVGLFFSPVPALAFQKTISYILLIFIVPQYLIKAHEQHGLNAIRDFIFLAALMVIMGFLLEAINPGYTYARGGRFRGVFGNPNGLSIFCSLIVAITFLARDAFPNLLTKNDLRWLIIPALLSLVLAGSRTSILAIIIFFVFTRIFKVSVVLGFLSFAGFVILSELIASNFTTIVNILGIAEFFRIETLESGSGRQVAWLFSWNTIQENFWLGRGFAFEEWLMAKNQEELNLLGHQGGVHNTYLQIWLNTGLIGLVLFLRAIFLNVLKGARRSRLAFPFLCLVMFSILPESWLAASLNPFSIIFFVGLTLMTEENFFENNDGDQAESNEKLKSVSA